MSPPMPSIAAATAMGKSGPSTKTKSLDFSAIALA
jgi:hypothetical protein